MTFKILNTSLLAVCLAFASRAAAQPGQSAPEKIQGTYKIVRGENQGKVVPPERLRDNRVVITDRSIVSIDGAGKKLYVADYKLDRSGRPYRITMTVSEGDLKGETARGLIARDGDRVKLIYALPGSPAPEDFRTTASGHELYFEMAPVEASPQRENPDR